MYININILQILFFHTFSSSIFFLLIFSLDPLLPSSIFLYSLQILFFHLLSFYFLFRSSSSKLFLPSSLFLFIVLTFLIYLSFNHYYCVQEVGILSLSSLIPVQEFYFNNKEKMKVHSSITQLQTRTLAGCISEGLTSSTSSPPTQSLWLVILIFFFSPSNSFLKFFFYRTIQWSVNSFSCIMSKKIFSYTSFSPLKLINSSLIKYIYLLIYSAILITFQNS